MGYTRGYTRLKAGQYLAVINEDMMVEIHAETMEEARELAERFYGKNGERITMCKIPEMIGYVAL